jgi:tetratricopeptide (TPR) repeat protein
MRFLTVIFLAFATLTTYAQKDQKDFDAYQEGITKFKSQDYKGSADIFTAIINNPEHSKRLDEDLYYYRGQSYYFTGEYNSALADLDQALTLNHYNKGTVHWYKARAYDKLNKKSEASRSSEDALSAAGLNKKLTALILADRAQYNAREGRMDAGQADLNKAQSLDPGNASISSITLASNTSNTPPSSRTAGEEKKTQVTVQTKRPVEQPSPSQNQALPQNETVKNTIVPIVADLNKDEKRYALVIGNSNYSREIGILKNPVNDATDVATELRNSNFEVQLLTNATYVQIREAMRKFQEKLTNGPRDQTVGLFYYAGHGVQYQDENYLVPVDANVQFEDDITRMCFPVQRMVLANMERTNSRMNIVILDACRNNPFPATSRSVGSGLAEMKRARGSFIAFATAPGSVASDGSGRNGLYTQELLKALRKPGLTIEQVFKEVRVNVLRMSGDRQYTWDSSNIIGEFVFKF